MKLAFAHDFPMIKDDRGNIYSRGAYPYSVWERYLKHFDKITVLARERETITSNAESLYNLSLSSGPNAKFISVPNLSSIKGKIIKKGIAKTIIKNELKKSDALVARLPSEIGKLAVEVAVNENIPYLIELVGCPYDAYRLYGNTLGKIYAPLSMYQTKKMVKKSKYTIYVTKEYLQKRYPTKGKKTNISNVNINEVDEGLLYKRISKLKSLENRTLKIGMVGTLNSKYKGFDKAIEFLSNTNPHLGNYEIHILGGGDRRNFDAVINENNMSSKVFFDGIKASGAEVFNWLDDIDLYIQPSLTEGLPRALVEALSRGCLAIGSTRGGIPELLGDKYLFDPLDLESFNKSIINALTSKLGMEDQIKKNLNKASEYTIPKLSKKRDDFIERFILELD